MAAAGGALIAAQQQATFQGFLGSDSARFPGQDTVDIYLGPAQGQVRQRQHVYCVAQGVSAVYYEDTVDGGQTWADQPLLAANIVFHNTGPAPPLGAVQPPPIPPGPGIAPAVPGPNRQQPAMLMVNGNGVVGYQLPWYHSCDVEFCPGPQPSPWRPLHYYQHTARQGHTDLDTPQFIQGGGHHIFHRLHNSSQVQGFRQAKP